MKYNKLYLILALLAMFFVGCKKGHYDIDNVHGINAEGEVLLPVATKSFTVKDLMERFEIQDEIEWTESGDMLFCLGFENIGVVDGANLLKFKDMKFEDHFVFENLYPNEQPPFVDTVLSYENDILFESEGIHVMNGWITSGHIDITIASNIGNVMRVVLRSTDITDGAGHGLELDLPVQANTFSFDLDGMYYATDVANTLNLSYELYVNVHSTPDPEAFVDITMDAIDMAFSMMQGYVEAYNSRNSIDSTFSLFPDNLSGSLELEGVRLRVSERNTFGLNAQLVVDTAWIFNEGMPPYSVLEPLPLVVDLPSQTQYVQVIEKSLSGRIDAGGGRFFASSNFIVNPNGLTEMVTVVDTSRIDTKVDIEIPFSFSIDDITYLDTVNMNLAHLDLPEMIEQLILDLTFASTLPMNLNASFYMYDSENDRITDTLLANAELIEASFDGQPKTTDVTLVIDENKVEQVMHSDRIIMLYKLDSDMHDVNLNASQKLDLFLKAKAKYNGNVEINDFD